MSNEGKINGIIHLSRQLMGKPLHIKYTFNKRSHLITARIPFPKKYPKTDLWKVLRKKNTLELAYIHMVTDLGPRPKRPYKSGMKRHVRLSSFYVRTYREPTASPDELAATRGLGREMLCKVLATHVSLMDDIAKEVHKTKNSFTTPSRIWLEASGGECFLQSDKDHVAKLSREAIEKFMKKLGYPTEHDEPIKELSMETLQKYMCNSMDNLRLVEYYKTLGFKPVKVNPFDVSMEARIADVLAPK